ncbi:PKD domain-containing protein [Cyclobacterium roseum]|uniref:PKD domain-containing protein n=1 Tax=Cyclobacterium roseum TaxID=2666137 RepID=UPI001391D5AD|nr:PKD domain-containing protein [Cyclobacterium roseum]
MKAPTTFNSIIDPSVFLTLGIAAFTSLLVLVYRVYHFEPCQEIEISVKQGLLHVGEIIQFKAISNSGGGRMEWHFGSDEDANKTGSVVNHTFKEPGRYEVVLTTNNTCKRYRTIYVREAPVLVDENLVAKFSGPELAEVGTPVTFKDSTAGATQWEWWFGENNFVDATDRIARYTYETPGTKKVRLLVNGHKVGEKMIEVIIPKAQQSGARTRPSPKRQPTIVIPKRPVQEPLQNPLEANTKEEKMFPEINRQGLEAILKSIVEGEGTVAGFYPYLCSDESMQVTYNGTTINLSDLNMELRDVKKIKKIKSLDIQFSKNPTTNCIFSMSIVLEKKGFPFF